MCCLARHKFGFHVKIVELWDKLLSEVVNAAADGVSDILFVRHMKEPFHCYSATKLKSILQ